MTESHEGTNDEPCTEQEACARMLLGWSGEWNADLGTMAAIKALLCIDRRQRRWTSGQISEAVLDDEDYIEVLKDGSFSVRDIQEARIASGDAAHDALIGSRLRHRPRPRLEALIWRHRRSRAEAALRACGVPVRVVVTSGRTKG